MGVYGSLGKYIGSVWQCRVVHRQQSTVTLHQSSPVQDLDGESMGSLGK